MKILYVDMDNVLVDFPSGIERLSSEFKRLSTKITMMMHKEFLY